MPRKENTLTPLFRSIAPKKSGIQFLNTITENERINMIDYFNLYNGGGVAVGDVNNDGLADVFFTGNQVSSRLYLNNGNLKFEDITAKAGITTLGWCAGVTMADVNQDGLLDIYICRTGNDLPANRSNLLYINNGKNKEGTPVFTESAAAFGLDFTGYSTQAAFFDYDKDGDLDMYLLTTANESRISTTLVPVRANSNSPSADRLFRNDTQYKNGKTTGKFTDVSRVAGIVYEGLGLGLGIADLNNDGWEDIYISNDFVGNDHLYINNHNGTFSERAGQYLKHQSNSAMGNDLADINNDGWTDIMVVDMLPPDNENRKRMAGPVKFEQFEMGLAAGYYPQYMRNTLQLNNGLMVNSKIDVSFSEIGQLAGVHSTDWSWAPLLADYDNDGWKDLLVTNGYRRDITDLDFVLYGSQLLSRQAGQRNAELAVKQRAQQMPAVKRVNYLFKNKGNCTFEDTSAKWGFTEPSFSNGAAYADLDNDGDLDVLINNIDEPASLYENTTNASQKNHYLMLGLAGHESNRFGLGADVFLYYDEQVQTHHQSVSRGFQSSVDYRIHFGTGQAAVIDSLEIMWPDGRSQKLKDIRADQLLLLDHKNAMIPKAPVKPAAPPQTLLVEASSKYKINYTHREDRYNDFARQFLLPNQHSRLGPGLAAGDVNNDGKEDFIVSGAYLQSTEIYLQQNNGKFISSPLATAVKYQEEMGILLFDADRDGDLDLYSASGSNEFAPGSVDYLDKLYINDGKGKFTASPSALPPVHASGSCVVAADYDQDGDLDLFVGGRLAPLNFPMPGESILLRNDTQPKAHADGIRFTDVTDQIAPGLRNAGMITTALFTDFDQDKKIDLIIAGEFMPIRFFKNSGKVFHDVTVTTGLPRPNSGWWNSLNGADFDNDGDIDYIAGNAGLNTRYHASAMEPVSVYAADFDANGSIDPILTHYLQGQEYPVHSRDDMIRQMVGTRRKFPRYAQYAKARLTDIVNSQDIHKASIVRADNFESSYLENVGHGKFRMKALPLLAQTAPVFGTLCQDINQDGFSDILLIGNSYAPDVTTGRYDAGIGLLLQGDGKGNFEPVSSQQSGFFVDGDAKALVTVKLGNETPLFLASQNAGVLKVFRHGENNVLRSLALQPMDVWAEITLREGTRMKQEFYYGASYLSQSSRQLIVPENTREITVYDYAGQGRIISASRLSSAAARKSNP